MPDNMATRQERFLLNPVTQYRKQGAFYMRDNPYELMYMNRMGDGYAQRALYEQFHNLIGFCVNRFPHWYAQRYEDEMFALGLRALQEAVNTYRFDRQASLATFATRVITHRLSKFVKSLQNAQMETVSLDAILKGRENFIGHECIGEPAGMKEPEYALHYEQALASLAESVRQMSVKEKRVMACWQRSLTYAQGAQLLGMTGKAYDCTLQRVRSKVRNAVK